MSGAIYLATGGTGGHVYPARALAEELQKRGHEIAVVTDQRGKNYEKIFADAAIHRIDAATPSVAGALGKVGAMMTILKGMTQARRLIVKERPSAIVGFGGYPSLPTMVAGSLCRLPTVIHEQNAVFGRVNRMMAGWAKQVAVSFPETRGVDGDLSAKLHVVGNPVRAAIADVGTAGYPAKGGDEPLTLFVFGGSQGARILSAVVPEAICLLPEGMSRRLSIVQQCRPEDLETVRGIYEQKSIVAEVDSFFHDMPDRLAAADLLVTRAGAGTVFEIAAAGRPALLVPFAAAADNHQYHNASALMRAGGALIMTEEEFSARRLSQRLAELMSAPEMLVKMASHALTFAKPDAAARLADLVLGLIAAENDTGRIAA